MPIESKSIRSPKLRPVVESTVLASAVRNPLDACGDAMGELKLIETKMKGLLGSNNRHGELQVCRTSALRLLDDLNAMIKAYEELR